MSWGLLKEFMQRKFVFILKFLPVDEGHERSGNCSGNSLSSDQFLLRKNFWSRLGSRQKKIKAVVVSDGNIQELSRISGQFLGAFLIPGKCPNPEWPRFGSVRFGYGLGVERFDRFRFSVPVVPLQKGFFLCFSTFLKERTVPVPVSVPGKRFRRCRFRFRFREKRF